MPVSIAHGKEAIYETYVSALLDGPEMVLLAVFSAVHPLGRPSLVFPRVRVIFEFLFAARADKSKILGRITTKARPSGRGRDEGRLGLSLIVVAICSVVEVGHVVDQGIGDGIGGIVSACSAQGFSSEKTPEAWQMHMYMLQRISTKAAHHFEEAAVIIVGHLDGPAKIAWGASLE